MANPDSNATASAPAPIVLSGKTPSDKLKEIIDRLEAGIKGVFESEQYKSYLKTVSKFHSYSMNNCMLIAMQKPDATHVAGYNSWRDNFGRHVKGDEKSIKIIAPMSRKIKMKQERIDSKSGLAIIGKDGKPETEEVEVTIPAFKVVSVFDISQTEGEPLPELGIDELTGDVESYDKLFKALESSSPVPITFDDIRGEAKGYYSQAEKRIVLQRNMSELQTLKTAIHEIAHARLHDIDAKAPKDVARPDQKTREVEAESVAFVVCSHFGLDTSDYSFGYIAGWSVDKKLDVLKASLDTIRKEAGAIINEVNDRTTELNKKREAEVMEGLRAEVKSTLQMLVDLDLESSGKITEGTLKAIRVQGYTVKGSKRPSVRRQLQQGKERASSMSSKSRMAEPRNREAGERA